jgi:ADP-ribose pyrophosphatase
MIFGMENFDSFLSSLRQRFEEKTVATQRLHEGHIINLREDTVTLPSGRVGKREIIEHKGAVAVLPVRADGKIVLVSQFRKATDEVLLELPAGGMNAGEDPQACVGRELIEECGLVAQRMTLLFSCFLAPGYSSELIHIFLAEELEQVEAQPEEDENLEIGEYELDDLLQLLDAGKIRDSKTICGILAYYRKQQLAKT